MELFIHRTREDANAAAATLLAGWLTAPDVRTVMLAAGNTPLELYARMARLSLPLGHLKIFALDEYVGVPLDEPRNCANLIRRTAVEPWAVSADDYFTVSSVESEAEASVHAHERRIAAAGGLDVIVLGLGQNGHLGFNEPGSGEECGGRVLDLDPTSIEANRMWFDGDYAPTRGATVGMKTILAARRVLLMAYGPHKASAVQAAVNGPRSENCPASLLQGHPNAAVFLDQAAATSLHSKDPFPSVPNPFPLVQDPQGCFVGIDVGGTKVAAGLVMLPEGRPLARRLISTEPTRGGRAVLDVVLRLARELAAEAAALGHQTNGIGLGVCELVGRDGRVLSANCIDWKNQPVREDLSTIAPAVIEADVRAAALAEAILGAGKGLRCFLYVTVGTGISSCLMIDGRPYLGASGLTGTMASSPLRVPCEECDHLTGRTLEEIAAGPALVARFNALGGTATCGHDVLAAAIAGDETAAHAVGTAADALGAQIALLVSLLDPEAVVIGGGLGLSEGLFWDQLVAATRLDIYSDLHRTIPILRAATGPDAGWIGAAARAWQNLSQPEVPASLTHPIAQEG